MVVQGTTLIVWIVGIVFVLATIVVRVMMVHVIDPAAVGKVSCNILLALEGMLDMCADHRHNARCLGQQNKPQEQRTKPP